MLVFHTTKTGESREVAGDPVPVGLTPDVIWIDLLQATATETAAVERYTGLKLPSFEDLSEIEASSRLRSENNVLYLSGPLVSGAYSNNPRTTPLGLILSPERLITIRFEPLVAFTALGELKEPTAPGVFAALIEAIVDRIADILERIAAELDTLSHRLFRSGPTENEVSRRPARESADLRVILRRVGHGGDLASKIRDSLLGVARIVPYVAGAGDDLAPRAVGDAGELADHPRGQRDRRAFQLLLAVGATEGDVEGAVGAGLGAFRRRREGGRERTRAGARCDRALRELRRRQDSGPAPHPCGLPRPLCPPHARRGCAEDADGRMGADRPGCSPYDVLGLSHPGNGPGERQSVSARRRGRCRQDEGPGRPDRRGRRGSRRRRRPVPDPRFLRQGAARVVTGRRR